MLFSKLLYLIETPELLETPELRDKAMQSLVMTFGATEEDCGEMRMERMDEEGGGLEEKAIEWK